MNTLAFLLLVYYLHVFPRYIYSRVSMGSLLLHIAVPPMIW